MTTPSTGRHLGGRLEDRAVEVQALAHDAGQTLTRLIAYDRGENERHLALQHADGRTADILTGQLVAGDVWEAEQLRRLLARAMALGTEGHRLAGDISRFLELRAQGRLVPTERAS